MVLAHSPLSIPDTAMVTVTFRFSFCDHLVQVDVDVGLKWRRWSFFLSPADTRLKSFEQSAREPFLSLYGVCSRRLRGGQSSVLLPFPDLSEVSGGRISTLSCGPPRRPLQTEFDF